MNDILPEYCKDVLEKLKAKAEQTTWSGIGVETIIHSLSPYRARIDNWIREAKESVKSSVHKVHEIQDDGLVSWL